MELEITHKHTHILYTSLGPAIGARPSKAVFARLQPVNPSHSSPIHFPVFQPFNLPALTITVLLDVLTTTVAVSKPREPQLRNRASHASTVILWGEQHNVLQPRGPSDRKSSVPVLKMCVHVLTGWAAIVLVWPVPARWTDTLWDQAAAATRMTATYDDHHTASVNTYNRNVEERCRVIAVLETDLNFMSLLVQGETVCSAFWFFSDGINTVLRSVQKDSLWFRMFPELKFWCHCRSGASIYVWIKKKDEI